MASSVFKQGVTERFNHLVELLVRNGRVKNNTAIAKIIGQPVQVVSKLLSGERIITLEQASALSKEVDVNSDWLLTGKGDIFHAKKERAINPDNIVAEVSAMIIRNELPKTTGEKIIKTITNLREENGRQKDEINSLNQKIIKMLELARKFSR